MPVPTPACPLDLDDDPIEVLNLDVAVNKDPVSSIQYTVSHTVYLNGKLVDEDSNVFELNEGGKSFVWRTWDLKQSAAVKKYCDERGYSYHRHWTRAKINCLAAKKDAVITVALRDTNDWQKVKDLVKLWDSNKRKGITVTIRADWGRKAAEDITTASEESAEEEVVEEENKSKRRV